jgi:hypothetical protein
MSRVSDERLAKVIVYADSDERQGYPVPMSEFKAILADLRDARTRIRELEVKLTLAEVACEETHGLRMDAERERDEAIAKAESVREALMPFALFASALKNMKPHWPAVQYGNQRLNTSCFIEARSEFPELPALEQQR